MTQTPELTLDHLNHLGIAEQGKLYALKAQHHQALLYYRLAMKLVTQSLEQQAPPASDQQTIASESNAIKMVSLRHYAECASESMEKMGAYQEVMSYLHQALAHYLKEPEKREASLIACRDYFGLLVRQAILLIKMDDLESARKLMLEAHDYLDSHPALKDDASSKMLLRIRDWVSRGMTITVDRIEKEQLTLKLFSVRKDAVDKDRATLLPHEVITQFMK